MNTLPLQTACRPRFFSLTDTKKIKGLHHEYGQAVQQYFHRLFPHRRWQVFRDPVGTPLAIDVEILYPTEEEPFYLLHTMGMSASPMRYPSGAFSANEGYSELCLILPARWPFRRERGLSLNDKAAWPIWLLMELGRFPHVHDVWMGYGFLLPQSGKNRSLLLRIRRCPAWSSFSLKDSWEA